MKKEQTHFGYKDVTPEEKTSLVGEVFSSVASKYDVMNDFMSFGLHRIWKDKMVGALQIRRGMKFLDVAGGTGDISFRIWNKAQKENKNIEMIVSDINNEMLEEGRKKAIDKGFLDGIKWQQENAEELTFNDEEFDYYTIAFGIRNVTHIDKALKDAYRVLKPGGRFVCMEFSNVENPLFRKIYDVFSFEAIPRMGAAVAGDKESYQYLVESIRKFPKKEAFSKMIKDAGFNSVSVKSFNHGVVAIHTGVKASDD